MEERGGASRAHWHLKQNGLEWLAENRADFDRLKRVLFYTTIAFFFTKVCYRLFIKTLKNPINLWKMGIR